MSNQQRYACPYCGNEVFEGVLVCCGELHAERAEVCTHCNELRPRQFMRKTDDGEWICEECVVDVN